MAAAFVQLAQAGVSGGTSLAVTLTGAVAGNTVILVLLFDSGTPAGLAQGGGDTLQTTARVTHNDTGLWESHRNSNTTIAATGNLTFNFSWTNATNVRIFATEWSGLQAGAAGFDQSAVLNGAANAASHTVATAGALAQADSLALA